ncbi:MAG: MlrC C-terminal domain-containing protein, partial [Sphaerochaetaceae bacterium]
LADEKLSTLDPPLLYQGFYDPQVTEQAFAAGVGASFPCSMGAKFDTRQSIPIKATAKVVSLTGVRQLSLQKSI